jgi:hypothetical protein
MEWIKMFGLPGAIGAVTAAGLLALTIKEPSPNAITGAAALGVLFGISVRAFARLVLKTKKQ